jgi:hypothetical protein
MRRAKGHQKKQEQKTNPEQKAGYVGSSSSLSGKLRHIGYTVFMNPMFGKNRDKYVRIGSWVLAIVVILSMLLSYFALVF